MTGPAVLGDGVVLRGGNLRAYQCLDHESIVAGPSETGKTVAECAKLHCLALLNAGAVTAIARKTYASIRTTVYKTMERVASGYGVVTFGGSSPTFMQYLNGSQVWLTGLDNPDRLLSAEFDAIYVNQAEEISLGDWELLGTRCTGRAGHVERPLLFGDCNPAGRMHWIPKRAKEGQLHLFNSRHADNPSLYDAQGNLTEGPNGGKVRMARLDALLTGVRRKRLWEGLWTSAEGAVYDNFDSTPEGAHVKKREPGEFRRWRLTLDVGITHPAALLVIGSDGDNRWHIYREFYKTGVLPSALVRNVAEWFKKPAPGVNAAEYCIVDEAEAGLIGDLQAAGVDARPGKGKAGHIVDECNLIRDRLEPDLAGKVRLTVDPSCENTIAEFESYAWDPKALVEKPIKEHDHAMDALRYFAVADNEGGGGPARNVARERVNDDKVGTAERRGSATLI